VPKYVRGEILFLIVMCNIFKISGECIYISLYPGLQLQAKEEEEEEKEPLRE